MEVVEKTHRASRLVGLALLSMVAACHARAALDTDGRRLRAELRRLLPDVGESERVVPFEIDSATADFARKVVEDRTTPETRALAVARALGNANEGLGLRYEWAFHNSARETLAAGSGTCMGLSSVLVGLARAVGLRARYVDAPEVRELREDLAMRVVAGHIAVAIETNRGPLYVDFTGKTLPDSSYRILDDLAATARYYSNRGYERIYRAEQRGSPVPWVDVHVEFERAVRIAPDFADGWNNRGVALARLGRLGEAEENYRRALALDPALASARRNLDALRTLDAPSNFTGASAVVDAARRLESPHRRSPEAPRP